jgi:hypothetical protein
MGDAWEGGFAGRLGVPAVRLVLASPWTVGNLGGRAVQDGSFVRLS